MKKIFKPSDFTYFEDNTDRLVAATIAQDKVEKLLQYIVKDPTRGATGDYAQGYRAALKDIMNELEEK